MARFSKNRQYAQYVARKDDLPYETIYRIAKMRLIDNKQPAEIARKLKVPYGAVVKIIRTKKQHNQWVDAVANLVREGLING